MNARPSLPDHRPARPGDHRPVELSGRAAATALPLSTLTGVGTLPLFEGSPQHCQHDAQPRVGVPRHREARSSIRILVDVPYAMHALSCGRTYVYDLLKRGELPIVKLGRSTRIPLAALEAYVDERLSGAEAASRPSACGAAGRIGRGPC